ncbi:hypothetical protein L1787_21170 [Acuticoccus sp. M5D2P5]|uniref:hypothetical protein n=1 Tax=Acuticoccus kalidii TaxID=2910977 RepID=UPI001F44F2B4|nr:hypothetical protein [Acuticoccus kalidii]MCF3935904.1 hypothetical protein [Acuticoccus kalidii]
MGMHLDASFERIRHAAIERRCLSYQDIAAANGLGWSDDLRPEILAHLALVDALALKRCLPMVTAIVLPQEVVPFGVMPPRALLGFEASARRLGYRFEDGLVFHRVQRWLTFEWGRKGAPYEGRPAHCAA